jgi:zinc transporter ZupT
LTVLDSQFLMADIGCLIAAIDVSHLTTCSYMLNGFWFLSTISAGVANTIRVLQNVFLTTTHNNNLIRDDYHKSSSFWKKFASFSYAFDAVLSTNGVSRSLTRPSMQSSDFPRCYFFLVLFLCSHFVIFVIVIMLPCHRHPHQNNHQDHHHQNHHHQNHHYHINCNSDILVTLNIHAPSLNMNFKAASKY